MVKKEAESDFESVDQPCCCLIDGIWIDDYGGITDVAPCSDPEVGENYDIKSVPHRNVYEYTVVSERDSSAEVVPAPPPLRASRNTSIPGAFHVAPPCVNDNMLEDPFEDEEDETTSISAHGHFSRNETEDNILLEARLVRENSVQDMEISLVDAEPLEETSNRGQFSISICLMLSLVVIMANIGVGAGTQLRRRHYSTQPPTMISPSAAPVPWIGSKEAPMTRWPTVSPSSSPSNAITASTPSVIQTGVTNLNALSFSAEFGAEYLPEKTKQSLSDPSSPQARALKWLKADPNFGTYSTDRKLQRFCLATVFFATNGDDWKRKDRWLSYESNECDWFSDAASGLVCSNSGRYTILSVNQNINITGTLPEEMWLLSTLVSLTFVKHDLQGSIPTKIGKMSLLENLALYELSVSGSLPRQIGNVSGESYYIFGIKITENCAEIPLIELFFSRQSLLRFISVVMQLLEQYPPSWLSCRN